jgi:hypothetical protein
MLTNDCPVLGDTVLGDTVPAAGNVEVDGSLAEVTGR